MSSEVFDQSDDEQLSRTVCHLCRRRKTKCDRKLPNCSFCVKAQVDCQYVDQPRKRGLRAGYVAELEARLEHLEAEVGELKRSREPPNGTSPCPAAVTAPASPAHHNPINTWVQKSIAPQTAVATPENQVNTHSALNDMMSLPHSFFRILAESWFKETQTWVPILNRERLLASVEALPTPVEQIEDIELRAVLALQISYSTQAICLGYKGRRRLSKYLKSQVLVDAMASPSMSSLRALLIIAILDYGSDDIPSTFSLLAICRRMCENIGTFRQLLKRIEGESPAHIGPPAIGMPSGEDAIPLTWCVLGFDAVSTLGISWRDVSAALVDHLSSVAFISTPDFRDSFRTHTHLSAIGLQPVHEFFSAQARYANLMDHPLETCEEMYQNLMSYVHGLPETSYTLLADGAIDFDVCQIFTRILSPAAIIMIYQRFVFRGEDRLAEIARTRCLASCDMIVRTMRSISDADAEVNNSPVAATMSFVAARFKLIMQKASAGAREPIFDILMHSINMLARRWQYARRLDIVLRAAITEVDTGSTTSLPEEFWDLTKSHLDISESLKAWVNQYKASLYVGNLDGPYI